MLRLWFVILMMCASAGHALTLEHRVLGGNNPLSEPVLELDLSGGIKKGDAARVAALLHSYAGRSFREISVTLNSPGGSLIEGLGIAALLMGRDEIVTVQVGTFSQPNASCASACVLIYLGADLRYLGQGGRIGVHQFFDPTGQISGDQAMDLAQRLSSEIVAVMRKQRVDLAFFDRMSQTARGIDWVPRDRLEHWRVVTGSVFDEWMEYKNIDGKVGLHMFHESLYGTNQMTLYCDRGLIGYAVLQEPRLAVVGSLMLVVSGQSYRIDDFEILNRDNGRTRAFFRIPQALLPTLRTARTVGARITMPSADMFWGFEQAVKDSRVREMVDGCKTPQRAKPRAPSMTEHPQTDFLGGDLTQRGVRGITFARCKQICLDAAACRAVSYVSAKRWCWPKGAGFKRRSARGVISAIKR